MRKSRNLIKRSNGYLHVRIYVPITLQARFGRKELVYSLGTKRKAEADRARFFLIPEFIRLFQMAAERQDLTTDQLRGMARGYFARASFRSKRERLARGLKPGELDHVVTHQVETGEHLKDWLQRNQFGQVSENVAEILEHEGVELDKDSDAFRELAHYCLRALIEVNRISTDRYLGDFESVPTDPLFKGSTPPEIARPRPNTETLGNLVEKFQEEHKVAWKPKTIEKYRANLGVCMNIIEADKPAREIIKTDIRDLKDVLSKLPANWSKLYPDTPEREVAEKAQEDDRPPLSPGSVNAYLGSLSSLFSWCVRQGFLEVNPSSDIRAVDPVSGGDKRHPFTVEQLKLIFDAPVYRGQQSEKQWKNPGNVVVRDSRYWLPLVGLFTGMRLGELHSLKREDFREEAGINFLSIRESKTKAGIRNIPIHPELIRCGIMPYFETVGEQAPLFPGYNQKGFSKYFRRFQSTLGLNDPKLVFHSFRHTFTDGLRAARVEEPLAKALLGHSDGTVTGSYGVGYPLKTLNEAITEIQYKDLGSRLIQIQ